jgi:hypothetical protein
MSIENNRFFKMFFKLIKINNLRTSFDLLSSADEDCTLSFFNLNSNAFYYGKLFIFLVNIE